MTALDVAKVLGGAIVAALSYFGIRSTNKVTRRRDEATTEETKAKRLEERLERLQSDIDGRVDSELNLLRARVQQLEQAMKDGGVTVPPWPPTTPKPAGAT